MKKAAAKLARDIDKKATREKKEIVTTDSSGT
jgi:hypothetical protein